MLMLHVHLHYYQHDTNTGILVGLDLVLRLFQFQTRLILMSLLWVGCTTNNYNEVISFFIVYSLLAWQLDRKGCIVLIWHLTDYCSRCTRITLHDVSISRGVCRLVCVCFVLSPCDLDRREVNFQEVLIFRSYFFA